LIEKVKCISNQILNIVSSISDVPEENEEIKPMTPCREEFSPQISPENSRTDKQPVEEEEPLEGNYDEGVLDCEPLVSMETDENVQYTSTTPDDHQDKNQASGSNALESTSPGPSVRERRIIFVIMKLRNDSTVIPSFFLSFPLSLLPYFLSSFKCRTFHDTLKTTDKETTFFDLVRLGTRKC
jgi:hypothetical protein